MAVVKTPQESRIGIKVANGTSASGAAQYKTLRFSNVKPASSDQDLFDVGSSIGGLQGAALVAILRTDEADLSNEQQAETLQNDTPNLKKTNERRSTR